MALEQVATWRMLEGNLNSVGKRRCGAKMARVMVVPGSAVSALYGGDLEGCKMQSAWVR